MAIARSIPVEVELFLPVQPVKNHSIEARFGDLQLPWHQQNNKRMSLIVSIWIWYDAYTNTLGKYHLSKQEAVALCDWWSQSHCTSKTLFSSNVYSLPLGTVKSPYYFYRHILSHTPLCIPTEVAIRDSVCYLMDMAQIRRNSIKLDVTSEWNASFILQIMRRTMTRGQIN